MPNSNENKIKAIISSRFSKMLSNVEKNFEKNVKQRKNNFFIHEAEGIRDIAPHMALTRSLESAMGNAVEDCAREIARLTFGKDNVPPIINPNGYEIDFTDSVIEGNIKKAFSMSGSKKNIKDILANTNKQVMVSKINRNQLNQKVTELWIDASKDKAEKKILKKDLDDIIKADGKISVGGIEQGNEFIFFQIDLGYYDTSMGEPLSDKKKVIIHELKLGGALDNKNAKSNVEEICKCYLALGNDQNEAYFSTLYARFGEDSLDKKGKNLLLDDKMILAGSEFWQKILPKGIDFKCFIELYKCALNDIKFSEKINKMLNS